MEQYNSDDLERLLKETTDKFRMYPSRRVWHSLYNDLHPGKKWPSVAVLLLLVTSIMYIGVTNSNETIASEASKTPGASIVSNKDQDQTSTSSTAQTASQTQSKLKSYNTNSTLTTKIPNSVSTSPSRIAQSTVNVNTPNKRESNTATSVTIPYTNSSPEKNKSAIAKTVVQNVNSPTASSLTSTTISPKADVDVTASETSSIERTEVLSVPVAENNAIATAPEVKITQVSNPLQNRLNLNQVNADEKAWMDDHVLHFKKKTNNLKSRLSYQVYVTPSIGYRTLTKNSDFSAPVVSSLVASPVHSTSMDYNIDQASAVNLEAGSSVSLRLSKRFNVKAGLQLNYTNYTINAYELNHPTFTTLLLNDPNNGYPGLSARSTTIANTPGLASKYLNNNTYQVSTPIGADFKLAGKNNLGWYTGVTVQPTYVTGGHAYLLSSDMKNYVNGNDFLRKFNVNGAFETFLSYKTRGGVIINAGPQVRYQFFSTYNQQYSYAEKLYNLGIKLGMTKGF